MSKVFSLNEVASNIGYLLESAGEVSVRSEWTQMKPIIRAEKDIVTLAKTNGKLKKGDVVLYKAASSEDYMLRRIAYVNGNAYVACGDDELTNDYNIGEDRIIGVMQSYDRNGRTHKTSDLSYKIYVMFLPIIKPIIRAYRQIKGRVIDFLKFLTKK